MPGERECEALFQSAPVSSRIYVLQYEARLLRTSYKGPDSARYRNLKGVCLKEITARMTYRRGKCHIVSDGVSAMVTKLQNAVTCAPKYLEVGTALI